jgi:hypothetical protein
VLCKQGVRGSNPLTSTNHLPANQSLSNSAVARLPQFGSIWVQPKASPLPQPCQAPPRLRRQQLVNGFLLINSGDLHSSLLPHSDVAFWHTKVRTPLEGNGKDGELSGCTCIPRAQLFLLKPGDTRHERQMIVVAAFLVALGKPTANGAMRDRFWICFDAVWRCAAQPFKACFDVPAISGVFRETVRFRLELFRGSDERTSILESGPALRLRARCKGKAEEL